ncbi:MAG TPA: site-specific integrase [Mycobacteriales bacterium]|nr:site-specific integrase [Mycobacteriales bacterium]
MASVVWRRGGWELRYRDRSGREQTERFRGPQTRKAPAEVVERKAEVERDLRRGTYVPVHERRTTFGEYYDRWHAHRRVSATRAYTDEGRAKLHVLPYWKTWRLEEIRPSDIDDWIHDLSTKMGPTSVRHCYALLRGPLRRAVKDRIIDDPCIDIVLPAKPEIRKTFDDVLTAEELDRLVAAVADPGEKYSGLRTNARYAAVVFMGGWLGPRWNEAIGLRVCDINPLRRELTFGRIVVNQNGGKTFTEAMSKTEDARTIPVPTEVMDALTTHIATYLPDAKRSDFLFTTTNGTHPLRGNFVRDVLHAGATRAKLEGRKVTWLTLRHTGASLMFDAGLTLFEVQQRLGHKDPNLTAKIYTHLMRERFEEGRERLENYMAEKRNVTSSNVLTEK